MRRIAPTLAALLLAPLAVGCHDDSDLDDDDSTAAEHDEPQVADVTLSIHETIGSIVVVGWEQLVATPGYVTYSFDDGVWHASPQRHLGLGDHQVLLPGIPYGTGVTVRIVNIISEDPVEGEDHSIETGPLPEGAPVPVLEHGDPGGWDPDIHYVMGSIDEPGGGLADYWVFILDRQGRVVWALKSPHFRSTLHSQPSHDGTQLLIDHNSFWAIFDGGTASQVQRLTLDGTQVELHDTPGLHHPFTELADGSLAWGAIDGYDELIQEMSPDGTIETVWHCSDFHGSIEGVPESAYCASNTLWWNEADDTFLMSFYSTETVVEIDRASGQVLRYFGHLPGAYTFDPEDSAFWWQHGCHYTEQGTLLVSSRDLPHGDETLVREYEIDDDAQTLRQVWTFGAGEGVYGSEMGEADRLPGGNTLHNYGSGSRIREVTPEGEVVWDVLWTDSTFLGRTNALEDLYPFLP